MSVYDREDTPMAGTVVKVTRFTARRDPFNWSVRSVEVEDYKLIDMRKEMIVLIRMTNRKYPKPS